MNTTKAPRFAICVDNSEYPASLELHKICRMLPDKDAQADGVTASPYGTCDSVEHGFRRDVRGTGTFLPTYANAIAAVSSLALSR
jgi:hypothetical protein